MRSAQPEPCATVRPVDCCEVVVVTHAMDGEPICQHRVEGSSLTMLSVLPAGERPHARSRARVASCEGPPEGGRILVLRHCSLLI